MGKNKQLAVNMAAQLVAFVVNFGISFFLTPFIIEHVGREAYGFVALGNNFVNYASMISAALNSMAGRFITIRIHQDDYESANQYYSSVILANLLLTVVLCVPSILIVVFIGYLVSVPEAIFGDVQALWGFLFANFLVGICTATFGVLLFAANRIDIQARKNIESNLLRGALLCGLFGFFQPKIWYLGLTSLVCTVYLAISNHYYARKFYPQISFNRKNFRFEKVRELLSSGVWNTVSSVGSLALTELDLLLSNLFLSVEAMGTLSIAKTIPNYVSSFVSSVINAFLPQLTINYATEDKQTFLASVRSYMRMLLFFMSIIYGLLFGFTDVFMTLWLPEGTNDIGYIYLLSMLTISDCFVSSVSYMMFNICTVTNRLRFSSITVICTGLVSFGLTYTLLKTTNLGLVAIAGVSVVLVDCRNAAILLPYGAKCLGLPWYTFYPDLARNIFSVVFAGLISFGMKKLLLSSYTWLNLILVVAAAGMVLLIFNTFVVLRKEERRLLSQQIHKVFRKR